LLSWSLNTPSQTSGVTYSLEPLDQARVLALSFHRILERLLDTDTPLFLLKFPRFVEDAEYCYERLKPILPIEVDRRSFAEIHRALVDPSSVRVEAELQTAERHDGTAYDPNDLRTMDRVALLRLVSDLKGELSILTGHIEDLARRHHYALLDLESRRNDRDNETE
jgi:hypothetical protein